MDVNEYTAKRVRKLMNHARVVMFAKGQPGDPVCDFSTAAFRLLEGAGVDFFCYNVLPDYDVFCSLPTISNWPTYPQIFVDGQLVGGLKQLKKQMKREVFRNKLPKMGAT